MKKSIILSMFTLILAIGVVQMVAQDYIVQVEIILPSGSYSGPESIYPGFLDQSRTPLLTLDWHDRSEIDLWALKSGNPLLAIDHTAVSDRLLNAGLLNNCPVMSDRVFHQVKLEKVIENTPVQDWQPALDWVRPASDWKSNPGMKHLLHEGAGIRFAL